MLNFIATVIVAVIGLIGIWIQTKSREKQDNILFKIEETRKESREADAKMREEIDNFSLSSVKCWLMTELYKIRKGQYVPDEEMKMLLHDAKRRYNKKGGDSYVDDVFDELRRKGLL